MINLSHLKYFYLCAQNESITKTAKLVGITQPALSIQVKAFEDHLGFKLFARTKKKLTMTPQGRELYKYAARLFEISDDIERFVKKLDTAQEVRLRLGVSDEVERPFIADVAGRLVKQNQGKKLSVLIMSKSHPEIVDQLDSKEVDLVITNKEVRSNLKLITRIDIPVLLISTVTTPDGPRSMSQQHPSLLLESLGQELISPTDDSVLGKETLKFLRGNQVNQPISITSNVVACLVRSVMESAGAAFLPVAYVSRELKKGSLKAYGPSQGFWIHSVFLYSHKGSDLNLSHTLGKIMMDLSLVQ